MNVAGVASSYGRSAAIVAYFVHMAQCHARPCKQAVPCDSYRAISLRPFRYGPTPAAQINQTRAETSRVRGAPTRRRRSAERPAIRPTRWRRLLAAVAISFSRIVVGRFRLGANAADAADVAAAAAGRAARFSYRVVENRRHRTISSLGGPANRHIFVDTPQFPSQSRA